MKNKILWFVIGFVISWLTWSVVAYVRLRPRDYTQSLKESEAATAKWLKKGLCRKLGGFEVLVSSDPSIASATIYPAEPNFSPIVGILDFNEDGQIDGIVVSDMKYTINVDDHNGDGSFDSYGYSFEDNGSSISYSDNNMDGLFDMQIHSGPEGMQSKIYIDSQWYDLIIKDKERFIKINGKLVKVKADKDVWEIVKD
ncbi:MAG: hypothetical protein K9M75_07390 [Phycisphaerae bacterium]|nr:hypothetical protein [Phycisphaerae bacterium]